MDTTFWFGMGCALLSACVTIPQTFRAVRRRDVAGISLTTHAAWGISWMLWMGYSATIDAWAKFAAEGLGLAAELTLLYVLLNLMRDQQGGRATADAITKAVLWALPGALLVIGFGAVAGVVWFAIALAVCDGVYLAPQMKDALTAPSLSGLSAWSFLLSATAATCWVVYGFLIGHPEAGGWGFFFAPYNLFMLTRIRRDRARTQMLT